MPGGPNDAAVASLLESDQTLGTAVAAILEHRYGEEIYDWEMVTVALEIDQVWQVKPPQAVMDRFAAIQTVMTSNVVFTRFDAMQAVFNALNVGDAHFQMFDKLTLEEIAWGAMEVALNRETQPYAHASRRYVEMLLPEYGMSAHDLPDILDEFIDGEETGLTAEELEAARNPGAAGNVDVIETYLDEQLALLDAQFQTIGFLGTLDQWLAQRELLDAAPTLVDAL